MNKHLNACNARLDNMSDDIFNQVADQLDVADKLVSNDGSIQILYGVIAGILQWQCNTHPIGVGGSSGCWDGVSLEYYYTLFISTARSPPILTPKAQAVYGQIKWLKVSQLP